MKVAAALASIALGFGIVGAANAAGPVKAVYYDGFDDTGSSITFSGPSFQTDDIASLDTTADPAFPGAAVAFGADYTADLDVATAGLYSFTLSSDDGSYLFIDGAQVAANGGVHGYEGVTGTDTLTAGLHSIEFQYDNVLCCGAQGDVLLPAGVTVVSAAPEPSTWALMIVGLSTIGAGLRYRRRKVQVAAAA